MSSDFKQPLRVKRRVLIVDDEPINREIMGAFLGGSYDVIYAENGEEAISLMKENSETISIVILDLLMPVMDGYEVLKIRNSDDKLKKIPVIVLTSEKSSEIESLKLGASDFITKPYDMPEVIIARVQRIIELFEDRNIINSVNEDELTGLFTKDFFIQYALQIERLDPERDMDMIYLDVNHFHLVNELYGRQFGKNVLKVIGEVIKEISEENDGIGCRSYADCFYIYCRHREEHTDILDRFRSRLAQMPNDAKIEIRMGVYSQVDKDSDMEICADRAKAACDTLRNDYTRFIAYYDEKLHEKNIYYEKLINNVHDAIKQRQFVVYYQPKYYIQGDEPKLKSAEALIRWIHPEYGMISPGDFIPLFEDNGLIQVLDNYVWSEVAKQIKTWKDKFGVSVPVSVNISRMDMYDPELENKLISNIENNGLDTSEYMLEITESAYADNAAQLTDIINRLRDKGFMIEMDDFGAGYSSLNMITEIPIDVLKIDMKFIRNMNKDEKNKKIVQLILDIAKFINAKTVAEGVEDEKQYKELKELGCDVIQGYYFSKPVPPDEFEKFIVG